MKFFFLSLLFFAPTLVFAVDVEQPKDFASLVQLLIDLIELLIYMVFIGVFFMGMGGIIANWVEGSGNEEAIKRGKQHTLLFIIVLVVLYSVWGIINLLRASFFPG
jgi:hypothetical protein